MNDANGVNLSDETYVVKSDNLSSVCSGWSNSISSIDMGSINISGEFSALIENGIATGLLSSLQEALKATSSSALNLSKSVQSLISEQQKIDKSGISSIRNRTNFNSNKSTLSNYKNTTKYDETEKNILNDDFKNQDEAVDEISDETYVEGTDLTNLDKSCQEIEKCILDMDDYSQIELINELINISKDNNLEQLLYDDSEAENLKKILLENINLSSELKEIITDLEPNIVQTALKSFLTSGNFVSDFSKFIFTIYENNKTGYNIIDNSSNLFNVYSNLISDDNLQNNLSKLYNGELDVDDKDNVVDFTKNYVDLLAKTEDVSSEELLSNSKYNDTLLLFTKDLTKSFSYLNSAKEISESASNTLHSNILYKEY